MLLWAAVCITAVGCSRRLASVVLDVPPEPVDTAQTVALDSALLRLLAQQQGQAAPDTVRPEIEQLLDPDTVKALLPKDHAGNVDWMEALRQGVIDPRHGPPGQDAPPPEGAFRFGFDFYLPGPDTTLNAFFPHSAHTEWVDCAQCHPRIFPVRGTAITMGDVFQGKYCGECHGKVAFPVMTGCERCHTKLPPMPAGRAKPDLIGTITLARVDRSSGAAAEAPESAPGTPTGAPTPTDASTAVDSTAARSRTGYTASGTDARPATCRSSSHGRGPTASPWRTSGRGKRAGCVMTGKRRSLQASASASDAMWRQRLQPPPTRIAEAAAHSLHAQRHGNDMDVALAVSGSPASPQVVLWRLPPGSSFPSCPRRRRPKR
jgi:c(7)-type cytochrome triheme protein